MPTSTFYPDANPETSTCDGFIGRNGVNEPFATIRAAAATMSGDVDSGLTATLTVPV